LENDLTFHCNSAPTKIFSCRIHSCGFHRRWLPQSSFWSCMVLSMPHFT